MAANNSSDVKTRLTIRDLAAQCDVSVSTVSKAMNPGYSKLIRAETRERILRTAEKVGYRPSWAARALVNQRTHTIALLYKGSAPALEGNLQAMVSMLSSKLQEHEYYLIYLPSELAMNGDRSLFDRVDGFVLLDEDCQSEAREAIQETDMPLLILNGQLPGRAIQIETDDVFGARLLTNHLTELGHQRVTLYMDLGIEGEKLHYSTERRRIGYEQSMRDAGLDDHIEVVHGSPERFAERIQAGGPTAPTAIAVHSHVLAINLMGELLKRGVRLPDNLSLATFNDVYPVAHMAPALTAISIPAEQMGAAAADYLLRWVSAPQSVDLNASTKFRPVLMKRASTIPLDDTVPCSGVSSQSSDHE